MTGVRQASWTTTGKHWKQPLFSSWSNLMVLLGFACPSMAPSWSFSISLFSSSFSVYVFQVSLRLLEPVLSKALLTALPDRVLETVDKWEAVFVLFAFAFLLEEYAQAREHGWGGELRDVLHR